MERWGGERGWRGKERGAERIGHEPKEYIQNSYTCTYTYMYVYIKLILARVEMEK